MKLNLILEIIVDVFKHNVVDVSAEVAYRCIEKMKVVADTLGLEA